MLALWTHLVTRLEGAQNTINFILGGHKNGSRVLEKMWMIQATFFTMKWGHFSLSTGRQEVSSVLRRQEEIRQASAKETGKKRDSKKVAPQRGSTQPTGKSCILKGDGRSEKFNKEDSEEE